MRLMIRALVAEGRTVVLSSHLLDEVEKTCDAIAIVDRGRVVVQGSIDELRDAGHARVLVEVDDAPRARTLLAAHPAVQSVGDDGIALEVALFDANAVADLNHRLVEAGFAVRRLEPLQASLEQRFLEVTTRLENAA
jgi:ABC-2 type transport system ATP-binding protein